MEENKKKKPAQEQAQKLSYEELAKNFGELYRNYQEMSKRYTQALDALNQRDFEFTSFFLTMLFKVMDQPEQYTPDFVKWVKSNIESMLVSFAESAAQQEQARKPEEPQPEAKDEAE